MTDRERSLRRLVADVRAHESVEDAFLAKSFTDRLLILDIHGDAVPDEIETRLKRHDFQSADAVYGDADGPHSSLGDVGDATRHHFVDVRTRGTHQSYIVD